MSLETRAQTTRMNKPELKTFLNAHIYYPEKALDQGEEGNVVITFMTDPTGNVKRRFVSKSVSPIIDSAAVRMFDLILWDPEESYGLPVEGKGEFKIRYDVRRYQQIVRHRGYDQLPRPHVPVDSSGEIYTVKELSSAPTAILDTIYPDLPHFIGMNLEFPDAAKELGIKGVVKLRFVIETSGLPSNIMVIDPVGGGCTEEAIRVVEMIRWYPGVKSEMAVRTCYNLSITFDPADELRNKYIPNQSNAGL